MIFQIVSLMFSCNIKNVLWTSATQPSDIAHANQKLKEYLDITPCSQSKVNQRFGGTYCFYFQDLRISRASRRALLATYFHGGILMGLFFDLKMEVIYSTEMSIYFQRTTLRYIPEDTTLRNLRCVNVKPYKAGNLLSKLYQTGVGYDGLMLGFSKSQKLGAQLCATQRCVSDRWRSEATQQPTASPF
jgi:hypothetical protein